MLGGMILGLLVFVAFFRNTKNAKDRKEHKEGLREEKAPTKSNMLGLIGAGRVVT